MSALGQKQTFAPQKAMSALPLIANIGGATAHVRFGPTADSCSAAQRIRYSITSALVGSRNWNTAPLGTLGKARSCPP
jgi:hypothetical protein